MFDLLKKKISVFTKKVTGKLEEKPVQELAEKPEELEVKPGVPPEEFKEAREEIKEETKEEIIPEKEVPEEKPKEAVEAKPIEVKEVEAVPEAKAKEEAKEVKEEVKEEIIPEKEIEKIPEEEKVGLPEVKLERERELKAKVRLKQKVKGLIVRAITIEEKDLKDFLEEFELSLLEADVEQATALEIVEEIRQELVGKKIRKGEDLTRFLKAEIRSVLEGMMAAEEINLLEKAREKKPFVILMLGPNGHGKTTSIAKLAHFFQENGLKVMLSSSDTFRAGSIEQLEKHAQKLGARVIKHKYGADPAAVAFDAVAAAKAQKADVVLIDTAGRMETNKNLMEELKKINRVVKPDLRLFVGEALAGNALLQMAARFDEELNLDGFILTKIDCDVKGGTAISLLYKIKKPILFLGTGQGYEDLMEFRPKHILDKII